MSRIELQTRRQRVGFGLTLVAGLAISVWAMTWRDRDPYFAIVMIISGYLTSTLARAGQEPSGGEAARAAEVWPRWAPVLVCGLAAGSILLVEALRLPVGSAGVGMLFPVAGFAVRAWLENRESAGRLSPDGADRVRNGSTPL